MDLLTVQKANADFVEVRKGSSETIWITTPQISSVFPSTPSDAGKLLLRGRLQWVSIRGRWVIFDEMPTTEYGVPKSFGRADSRIMEVQQYCAGRGRSVRWVLHDQVPHFCTSGWHVFYDQDGRYFSSSGQILMVDGLKL